MANPLFTVVIPTRNRASLLRLSLQCVLRQRFDDFEVLVSDNDSADSTPDVVAEYSDSRIRYVRTPRMLHMPDSWEFALSHATGQYVTFVSDDDGVSPGLLEMIHRTIAQSGLDIVAWPFGAIYHHSTSEEVALRNTLAYKPLNGRTEEVTSTSVVADLSALRFTHRLPRLINSCASAAVLSDVKQKFGRVFSPSCPDYSSGLAQLSVRSALAYVNELVLIWGVSNDSIGYSVSKGGAAGETYFNELRKDNADRAQYVPMQVRTPMNYAVDSLLHIKSLAPRELAHLNIDPIAYYTVVGQEMLVLERNGVDMRAGFDEMRQALKKESLLTQLTVGRRFMPFKGGARLRAARAALSTLKARLTGGPPEPLLYVKGDGNGFGNMCEAAVKLEQLALSDRQRGTDERPPLSA